MPDATNVALLEHAGWPCSYVCLQQSRLRSNVATVSKGRSVSAIVQSTFVIPEMQLSLTKYNPSFSY